MKVIAALPVLIAFLVGALPAHAWTWPVAGPVLQPFVFGADPFAAGQHRGIDIGGPPGAVVVAPAGGTVTYAGTLPRNGRTVTVETSDGLSVTLLHLGSITVARGARLAEGDPIGTIGPSGEPEHATSYVHLGVRISAAEHGYVDPLSLLPPIPAAETPAPSEPPGPEPVPEPPSQPAAEERPAEVPAGDAGGRPSPGVDPADASAGAEAEPAGSGTTGGGPAEAAGGEPDRSAEQRPATAPTGARTKAGLGGRGAAPPPTFPRTAAEGVATGRRDRAESPRPAHGAPAPAGPAATAPARALGSEATALAPGVGGEDERLGSRVGLGVAGGAAAVLALVLAAAAGARRLGSGGPLHAVRAPSRLDAAPDEPREPPTALELELDSWLEGVLGPHSSCAFPGQVYGRRWPEPVRRRAPTRPRAAPARAGRYARAG